MRRVIALTLVFLFAFTGTAFALAYQRFQSNIDRHDISDLLGSNRPTEEEPDSPDDEYSGEPLTLLIMGTDSRDGENAAVDGSNTSFGMRSDTTLVAHISADRSNLTMVSIPRDTLVEIPSCTLPDGSTSAPRYSEMFNAAFSIGSNGTSVAHGAACTILTVEQLTGVLIDDFVVVDFNGFINLVDALGGVPMDIPEAVNDRAADLQLEAGCQVLGGQDALAFARARKNVGTDGSDIARIGRQQELMMAILNDTLSSRVLTDPIRLYRVADAATQTVTAGRDIGDLTTIVGLASSLSGLRSENIHFLTMPFDWAGARVVPNTEFADQVWEAIRFDRDVDQRLTGAGWEIAERIAEDEAAAEGETDEAGQDSAPPEADEVTTPPSTSVQPEDDGEPLPTCTRENAS